MSDSLKRSAGLGGLLLLGVLLLSYVIGDGNGLAFWWQDDRPPIIVEDGSVHIGPKYPWDDGTWGTWRRQPGSSPVWFFDHPTGPAVDHIVTSVLNASCNAGGATPAWRRGPIRIRYTDGTATYTINVLVTAGVTQVRTNQGDPTPTIAAATPWRLDFGGSGHRLMSIESAGSTADTCTFSTGASRQNPIIVIEQRRQ
jgi:hypothetical protein